MKLSQPYRKILWMEFKSIHEEILRKGELTEFYERLKLL